MDKPGKPVKRKRPRRTFTPEFKAEAVRLCRAGDRNHPPALQEQSARSRLVVASSRYWANAVVSRDV